jgi:hypothetical protein
MTRCNLDPSEWPDIADACLGSRLDVTNVKHIQTSHIYELSLDQGNPGGVQVVSWIGEWPRNLFPPESVPLVVC